MLRFKVLVSAVPLLVAATVAGIEFFPAPRPCIAVGAETMKIEQAPWHADLHVSFTDDPSLATVRVALTDSPEAADFSVVDDSGRVEDGACEATPATQLVSITAGQNASAPIIYLSQDGPADYRIFVRSKSFTAREAAALIVAAHSERSHIADASL
jgi:hypothetical protein